MREFIFDGIIFIHSYYIFADMCKINGISVRQVIMRQGEMCQILIISRTISEILIFCI